MYGFYDECKRRTNIKIWKTFIDVFNTLPIASIVASKIFCVHGGLSPSLKSMDDIRRIQRPTDVPDYGLLNDLVWSDPSDTALDWEDNERGVSFCYGKSVINAFLATHVSLNSSGHLIVVARKIDFLSHLGYGSYMSSTYGCRRRLRVLQ